MQHSAKWLTLSWHCEKNRMLHNVQVEWQWYKSCKLQRVWAPWGFLGADRVPDILLCHSRNSTGVINNVNDGCVPFRSSGFSCRACCLAGFAHQDTWDGAERRWTLWFTPVLYLLCSVKTSAVNKKKVRPGGLHRFHATKLHLTLIKAVTV